MPEPASRPAAAGDQPPYLHPAYLATRLRAPTGRWSRSPTP